MTEAILTFQQAGFHELALRALDAADGEFFIYMHGPEAFDRILAGFAGSADSAWAVSTSSSGGASASTSARAESRLSTDSRTGALSLYEKVGMVVTDVWVNRGIDL